MARPAVPRRRSRTARAAREDGEHDERAGADRDGSDEDGEVEAAHEGLACRPGERGAEHAAELLRHAQRAAERADDEVVDVRRHALVGE